MSVTPLSPATAGDKRAPSSSGFMLAMARILGRSRLSGSAGETDGHMRRKYPFLFYDVSTSKRSPAAGMLVYSGTIKSRRDAVSFPGGEVDLASYNSRLPPAR